jgi:hypothetical protein
MTDDRSLERAARSWIEAGPTRAPERAVDAALQRIELTPQERDFNVLRRIETMPSIARVAAAAAIGVLLVGGALFMLGRPSESIGAPSPAPSASPSATPSEVASASATAIPAAALPAGGPISAGRYVLRMADTPVDVEFTVGSGWTSGGYYINTDQVSLSFWTVPKVYADACDITTAPVTALGGTVDDLVAALDSQANTDMSEPVEVVVDGYRGMQVGLSPSVGRPGSCWELRLWTIPDGSAGRGIDTLNGCESGCVEPVTILDVDGERVVFVGWASTAGQSGPNILADVIDSMTLTKR